MIRDFPVPPDFAEHAAAYLDGRLRTVPPAARPSSTVLLLRDGNHGIEVFLLRRRTSMAFAGGMYAFPGGGVDPRDADADVPWAGPTPVQWGAALGSDPDTARALVAAAIRELFEECGVLLAGPVTDPGALADCSDDTFEADRLALLDRSLALTTLLARRGLVLRSDLLAPWAHWTTPIVEPRRYDTRFFVAVLPAGQCARDVGGESDRVVWSSVRDAVTQYRAGELVMLPPTITSIEDLAKHADAASVLRDRRAVRRVMPWPVRTDAGVILRVDLDGRGGGEPGPDQERANRQPAGTVDRR